MLGYAHNLSNKFEAELHLFYPPFGIRHIKYEAVGFEDLIPGNHSCQVYRACFSNIGVIIRARLFRNLSRKWPAVS